MQHTGCAYPRCIQCAHGAVGHPGRAHIVRVVEADMVEDVDIDAVVESDEFEVGTTEGALDAAQDPECRGCANSPYQVREGCCSGVRYCRLNWALARDVARPWLTLVSACAQYTRYTHGHTIKIMFAMDFLLSFEGMEHKPTPVTKRCSSVTASKTRVVSTSYV